MKILIAPNSMKGSLNAFEFADTVEKAFQDCSPEFSVRKVPVADGGDLTGEVLGRAMHAQKITTTVDDPLGRKIQSGYALSGKTAIIEMAAASGLKHLSSGELNPMKTSSFGTGQLMAHAIENGCTEILLGVGGSATVDGGLGMIEALGFRFFDNQNNLLHGNGENLQKIDRIESPASYVNNVSLKIISDVNNPLLGKNGAAAVFGPQKGATPQMVQQLEDGLKNWCAILEKESSKKLSSLNGAGAAGGIALPLIAFLNAEIVPGAEFILKKLNFESHVKWADCVITGEGKIDAQTLNDKAPAVVARLAHQNGKPIFAIGGSVEREASEAFNGVFSFLNQPLSLENSMKYSRELLYNFSFELAKLIASIQEK
ncbi:glycerate kinase [Tangfeifania diversioriginum]|uniref:Glycerate kinase n=1 Tax=Tangfeifania diversioriginum TaxID=1168035 RepID=A0A1M6GYR0_9BACT|nr:glycerate kinase [Tangfeifania diversioriginum]SHJ15108.1 glycerate kinase [Tangfeifania diversioriginum]